MTQDEIIELALKVDLMGHELAYSDWYKNRLKAFGKLVAEKERKACIVDIQMHIPRSGRDTLEYKMAMRMIERIRARGEA